MRFLLDTDHVSLQERGNPTVLARLRVQPPEALGVSVVTMQEVLQGRLVVLNRQLVPDQILLAYAKLQEAVHFFTRVQVVAFDTRCQHRLEELRAQGIRIGTLDLRIAATALVHDQTLVTRNHKDFAHVPGLRFESRAEA